MSIPCNPKLSAWLETDPEEIARNITAMEEQANNQKHIEQLEQRIGKARQILEQCGKSWRGIEPDIDNAFQMALAALEGK